MEQEKKPSYGYYSNILKKPFESLELLEAAERAYEEKRKADEDQKEQKKNDAAEVTEAYKNYLNTMKSCEHTVQEAYTKYIKARNDFIAKYGSYHQSFYADETDEPKVVTLDTFLEALLNSFPFNVL